MGIELNAGCSENSNIQKLAGAGTIIGGSADLFGFANGGYEMTISQSLDTAPLHNVSAGAYGNPFVPGEFHMFTSYTVVELLLEW